MALPVIVAAIRDLSNPGGLLRQIARSLMSHSRDRNNASLRETGYTVIDHIDEAAALQRGRRNYRGNAPQ